MRRLQIGILSIHTAAALAFSTAPIAASPTHEWSYRYGGSSNEEGLAVAVNQAGTVAVTGGFQLTANFGGSDLTSNGSYDVFVASYDETGTHLWSRSGGDVSNLDQGRAVAVGNDGSVIVTGMFGGSASFGGPTFHSAGDYDIFLVKYGNDGSYQWGKRFGSTDWDLGYAVATDDVGNVFLAGTFRGTVGFGGTALVSEGNFDGFLAKFDANGTHQWSRGFGGGLIDYVDEITFDSSGNLVVVGTFQGTANFGGSDLGSAGGRDVVVARYAASDGAHLLSRRYGGGSDESAKDVIVGGDDNIYVIGDFEGTADFGGTLLESAGFLDVFLVKLDSSGDNLWNLGFGGEGWDAGESLALDAAGNVCLTGQFQETIEFGVESFVSQGLEDSFLAGVGSDGVPLWAMQHGSFEWDTGYGLATSSNALIAVGSFMETVDFGGGGLTSSGARDLYIARYEVDSSSEVAPQNWMRNRLQTYPNPFVKDATLEYSLAEASHVEVSVHDVHGRRLATLLQSSLVPAGTHLARWDGRSSLGPVPPGTYFVRLQHNGSVTGTRLVRVSAGNR